MDTENRKFTVLSFFLFSALCTYILFLMLTQIADWLKLGGSNVVAGLSWPVVGWSLASVLGLVLMIILSTNQKSTTFFDDVFAELRKTTFPNMNETTKSTVVVSIMVAVAALILSVMDWVWGAVFHYIL